ncbi:hypothetical protein ACA910_004909 [Epithemia clementina (nom. ined.)]
MKFAIAALLAVAASAEPQSKNDAKSKYVSNLLRNAKTLRKLEDNYPVDISSYSVKFNKCQFVRSFDDDLADDEESTTVLGTTRFAIFRLCPNNCSDDCKYNYGEYILDLESYLQSTVQYFQEYEQEMCNACNENCANDDNANRQLSNKASRFLQTVDCTTCVDDCLKMQNMEQNGYVDATDFLECKLIYQGDGDDAISYYAAPICTYEGEKINIGVFTDANCQEYDSSKKVEDYFEKDDEGNQAQLSHALLKMTYQDTCISCLEVNNDNANNANDAQDADNVLEFCEELYNMAGKCEYSHGFNTGYYGVAGYENQQAQEDVICQFIKSLKSGTYDETGQINLTGASYSIGGGASTTGGQKFALTFFILGTVGLAVYAAMLHSKLTKGSPASIDAGSGALA